jgi:DNA-binding PadR family transcriptional regulator
VRDRLDSGSQSADEGYGVSPRVGFDDRGRDADSHTIYQCDRLKRCNDAHTKGSHARRWTAIGSKGATLELAVLGLLHDSPLHGYELRKRLNLLLGWTRLLSYGSLYPALKRMLRAGLVTEVAMASPGVSRRQRIVYQITPAGTEYFGAKITDVGPSAWEDEDFNMRFAFFSRTDSDVRLRILEGRRSRLQERLDRARRSRGPEGADHYVTELQRHAIESVEREVRWLTDLIAAERGAPAPQPATPVVTPAAARTTSQPAKPKPSKAKTPPPAPATSNHTDSPS